ncbi:hypothetical protein Aglo03_41760 [Actinokineospora globicatena]|uniref:Uncharacterized protein n=1 Tax=Actinokineospora globicatena TaxID=103729 RepID=A0A9W6QP42_9PSEU|nr:hypothetical protein Aglo03_41760 [Actinokineospora globicatena]
MTGGAGWVPSAPVRSNDATAQALADGTRPLSHTWPTTKSDGWVGMAISRTPDHVTVAVARMTGIGTLCDLHSFYRADDHWHPAAASGGTLVDPTIPIAPGAVDWFYGHQISIGEDEDLLEARVGIASPTITAVEMRHPNGTTELFHPSPTTGVIVVAALVPDFGPLTIHST